MVSRLKRSETLLLLALLLMGLSPSAAAKSTDDVVILNNGDRLTGEIKSLEQGELEFKCAYMVDPVRLDWARVVRLESKDQYLVLLINGQTFTARIRLGSTTGASDGRFQIQAASAPVGVRPADVLIIRPAERSFWKQLKGAVDYGFSYTSGNRQYQTQLAASAIYDGEGFQTGGNLSSALSGQSEGNRTRRNTFDGHYWRLFKKKWFFGGLVDMLSSEQQSLDLRTTLGGAVGRYLVRTNRTSLSAISGVAVSREHYSADEQQPRTTSTEALLGLNFSTFRFSRTNISSRFVVWPSLTEPGRLRIGLNSNLRIKLFKDFTWNLNLYENYDSHPPIKARKNDLGISTSFGWTY